MFYHSFVATLVSINKEEFEQKEKKHSRTFKFLPLERKIAGQKKQGSFYGSTFQTSKTFPSRKRTTAAFCHSPLASLDYATLSPSLERKKNKNTSI